MRFVDYDDLAVRSFEKTEQAGAPVLLFRGLKPALLAGFGRAVRKCYAAKLLRRIVAEGENVACG